MRHDSVQLKPLLCAKCLRAVTVKYVCSRFTDGVLSLVCSWRKSKDLNENVQLQWVKSCSKNDLYLPWALSHWQKEIKCICFAFITAELSVLLQQILCSKRIRCPFITVALRDANPHQRLFVANAAIAPVGPWVKALAINLFHKPQSATFQQTV